MSRITRIIGNKYLFLYFLCHSLLAYTRKFLFNFCKEEIPSFSKIFFCCLWSKSRSLWHLVQVEARPLIFACSLSSDISFPDCYLCVRFLRCAKPRDAAESQNVHHKAPFTVGKEILPFPVPSKSSTCSNSCKGICIIPICVLCSFVFAGVFLFL